MYNRYWSCSKFADWLRGTPKPNSASSEGWDNWNSAAQSAHLIRYWLAEEGLDYVQNFVTWPVRKLYDVKYYVNNRWVTNTHQLTAHASFIKPGEWRDVGNRFLPCLFSELVNFVEIEQACNFMVWAGAETRDKYKPPFWASGWFKWRTWRCPAAGLEYLAWASTLVFDKSWAGENSPKIGQLTPQAESAIEILALYHWWKTTYPQRPDPHDVSGWSAMCEAEDSLTSLRASRTKEEKKAIKTALELCHKIESQYEKEDTAMMCRLIKIRDALWT